MRQLTILWDMDGILADLHKTWYAEYNARTGDDLSIDRVTEWDTSKFCKQPDVLWSVLNDKGCCLKPPPIQPAINCMEALIQDGHNVVIASACANAYAYTDKALWLKKYLPDFPLRNVMLGYHKHMLKADVLVDDGPHNLKGYKQAWPEAFLATVAYPYNQDCASIVDVMAHDYRNMSGAWQEILAAIRRHADDPASA